MSDETTKPPGLARFGYYAAPSELGITSWAIWQDMDGGEDQEICELYPFDTAERLAKEIADAMNRCGVGRDD